MLEASIRLLDKYPELLASLEKLPYESVFIYGSRVRKDFTENSDYEIGILFKAKNYISQSDLNNLTTGLPVRLFPFVLEDFLKYQIDTPFQKSIYLRDLKLSAKTILGRGVVDKIKLPPITVIDLLERINFDIGQALAAVFSFRSNDLNTASAEFSKSCLFGTRCLIILKNKTFPLQYNEIYTQGLKLVSAEYITVINTAFSVRQGAAIKDVGLLYKNISLLNTFIEPVIENCYQKFGAITLLN